MKSDIPLQRLLDTTTSWLNIQYISTDKPLISTADDVKPHRDDHYLFFLVEKGSCRIMVGFEEVTLGPNQRFSYYLPRCTTDWRKQMAKGGLLDQEQYYWNRLCRSFQAIKKGGDS